MEWISLFFWGIYYLYKGASESDHAPDLEMGVGFLGISIGLMHGIINNSVQKSTAKFFASYTDTAESMTTMLGVATSLQPPDTQGQMVRLSANHQHFFDQMKIKNGFEEIVKKDVWIKGLAFSIAAGATCFLFAVMTPSGAINIHIPISLGIGLISAVFSAFILKLFYRANEKRSDEGFEPHQRGLFGHGYFCG